MSAMSAIRELQLQEVSADEFAARFFIALARKVPEEAPENRASYDAGTVLVLAEFEAISPEALDSICGAYIEKTQLAKNSPTSRVEREASPGQTPHGDQSGGDQPKERQTERLMRMVNNFAHSVAKSVESVLGTAGIGPFDVLKQSMATTKGLLGFGGSESYAKIVEAMRLQGGFSSIDAAKRFAETSSGFDAHGVSDALKRSMEHTSTLARGVDDLLFKADVTHAVPDFLRPKYEIPELHIAPNPVYETNRHLADLTGTVTQLVDLASKQAELSQAIRETSAIALQQSIQAGDAAKAAALLAQTGVQLTRRAIVVAILIALLTLSLSIYDNHQLSNSTDRRLQEEIRVLSEISGRLRALTAQPPTQPGPKPEPRRGKPATRALPDKNDSTPGQTDATAGRKED